MKVYWKFYLEAEAILLEVFVGRRYLAGVVKVGAPVLILPPVDDRAEYRFSLKPAPQNCASFPTHLDEQSL
jgi:hypothetical protein